MKTSKQSQTLWQMWVCSTSFFEKTRTVTIFWNLLNSALIFLEYM